MPEVEYPMRPATQKTRTVNHIGFSLDQRLEQVGIVGRVVLEVSILNEYKISCGFLDAPSEGRAFSHVLRLQQNPEAGVSSLQLGQNFARSVARTIVHAYQFHLLGNGQNALHNE